MSYYFLYCPSGTVSNNKEKEEKNHICIVFLFSSASKDNFTKSWYFDSSSYNLAMKKLFFVPCLIFFLATPLGFAEKSMTVGETLTMYFSELFPNINPEINNVTLKYSGIGNRNGLRTALQKGIYYGMLPNSAVEMTPDREMTDRAFAQLLRRHFGVRLSSDESALTQSDYDTFMVTIRASFAYRLLRLMNTPEETTIQTESVPESSKLSNANNYYLLEKIYSILQESYLR